MIQDGPKKRDDGRYDYTREWTRGPRWEAGVMPLGYCAGWSEETKASMAARLGPELASLAHNTQERSRANIAEYHTDGHETSEEACACYKRYLLDNDIIPGITLVGNSMRCQVCDEWTRETVTVGGTTYGLCRTHDRRRSVESFLCVGVSIHS